MPHDMVAVGDADPVGVAVEPAVEVGNAEAVALPAPLTLALLDAVGVTLEVGAEVTVDVEEAAADADPTLLPLEVVDDVATALPVGTEVAVDVLEATADCE